MFSLPISRGTLWMQTATNLSVQRGNHKIKPSSQKHHIISNNRTRHNITIEDTSFNNTLAPGCDNLNNADIGAALGETMMSNWAAVYLQNALSRLAPQIDGVNLTASDVFAMQEACAYETVALGASVFCDLFTEEEWISFEYAFDLLFWYGFGSGNPTAAAVGIGYVQELVARLTQSPITVHNTTTNATLTNSNVTFPLNQPIYVDATHDTVISSIVVAMNFTSMAANGPLPTGQIPENQTYFTNQIAPFASRLVGQVLSCPSSSSPTHIRWLLNDGVVPLTGIAGCSEDKNGLCPLSAFISGMETRLAEVDYAFDCQANYTIPNPDTIVDGRPPIGVRP